ncbi:hypothetical protein K438DRAFT_1607154, partial [Mycena galopus ATCC 62051]
VPVYDARSVDFDFASELPLIAEKLPRWHSEVPRDSFVVVGYTATTFTSKSKQVQLGCNLLWVILCGVPVN